MLKRILVVFLLGLFSVGFSNIFLHSRESLYLVCISSFAFLSSIVLKPIKLSLILKLLIYSSTPLIVFILYLTNYQKAQVYLILTTLLLIYVFYLAGFYMKFGKIKLLILNVLILNAFTCAEYFVFPYLLLSFQSHTFNTVNKNHLPDFELIDLQGNKITKKDFENKVVLLDFWSVSCGYCIMQFPYIEQIMKHFEKDEGVKFYIVNIGTRFDTKKNINHLINNKKIKIPVLIDSNSEFSRKMSCLSVPQTFIIDKTGDIVFHYSGYQRVYEEIFVNKIIQQINIYNHE